MSELRLLEGILAEALVIGGVMFYVSWRDHVQWVRGIEKRLDQLESKEWQSRSPLRRTGTN